MEEEDYLQKNFNLCERHIKFLENINENTSLALRTHLDSIIRLNKKLIIKKTVDETLTTVILGVILLFLANFSIQPEIVIILTGLGAGIMTYGLIGGIVVGLANNRTKRE